MEKLVDHILGIADISNKQMTNLQLQNVLYLSFIELLISNEIEESEILNMYSEGNPFLVWKYGPVIEYYYEKYKKYGSMPILEKGEIQPELEIINESIKGFLEEDPFELAERNRHSYKWQQNEKHIRYGKSNISYTFEDLKDEAENWLYYV